MTPEIITIENIKLTGEINSDCEFDVNSIEIDGQSKSGAELFKFLGTKEYQIDGFLMMVQQRLQVSEVNIGTGFKAEYTPVEFIHDDQKFQREKT